MQFNRLIHARHGLMLVNSLDRYIGQSLITYGEFSEGEIALFKSLLGRESICVDAGANMGALTIPMARLAKLVVAVEPQPFMFHLLCANVALNSLTNVQAFQLALDAQSGTMTIPLLDPRTPNNFGGLDIRADSPKRVGMNVTTIDSLSLPACHFIKCDVEGMEEPVLRGAEATVSQYRPFLYVENDRNKEALHERMRGYGYRLFEHCPPLFRPDNFNNWPHDIFDRDAIIVSFNLLGWPVEKAIPEDLIAAHGLKEVLGDRHEYLANGAPVQPMPDSSR